MGQLYGACGGAIYTDLLGESQYTPTTTDIISSKFTDNTAMGWGQNTAGGAIADDAEFAAFEGSSLNISGSTFTGNQALGAPTFSGPFVLGGAIYSPQRPLAITSSSFLDNQATGISPPAVFGAPGGQGVRWGDRSIGTVGDYRSIELQGQHRPRRVE